MSHRNSITRHIRTVAPVALLVTALTAVACAPEATVAPSKVESVQILEAPASMYAGDEVLLGVSVVDDRGQVLVAQPITWRSSDSTRATVRDGRVRGIASGSALISAEAGGRASTVRIDVFERVASVVVSPVSPTISVGGSLTLAATLLDRNGDTLSGRPITWSVPDSAVVAVTPQGVVVAKGYVGGATRTAVVAAASEGKSGTVTILVSPLATNAVLLSVPTAEINPGQEFQLGAEPRDSLGNALTGRLVSWSTSDTTVATVSSDGRAHALAYLGPLSRAAFIRATVEGRTGEMTLTVRPLAVSRVQMAVDSVRLLTGDSVAIAATVASATGDVLTGRSVSWRIQDTTIARVSATGLVRAAGQVDGAAMSTTLIAESEGRADTVSVRVESRVARLEIVNDRTLLLRGDTAQLAARTFGADGAEILGRLVRWSSDNESVLRVSTSGLVTAVGAGRTSVFAVSEGRFAGLEMNVTIVELKPQTISAGGNHTCAIAVTGEAYCWGFGDNGQLGSDGGSSNVPRAVFGGHLFSSLAVANSATCGLDIDGRVLCWGDGGVVGSGPTTSSLVLPREIEGGRRYVAIASGQSNACALTREGEAYCWGDNSSGQLGTGTRGGTSYTPRLVLGGHRFRAIAPGTEHTCGVTFEQRVLCWGSNGTGELGDGTAVSRYFPNPIASGESFIGVSAAYAFSCALTVGGRVFCWGENGNYRLGSDVGSASFVPTAVLTEQAGPLLNIVGIRSSQSHSCGLDSSGAVFCWGPVTDQPSSGLARPVGTLTGFGAIAPGAVHACGINAFGTAYCWGYVANGRLGAGAEVEAMYRPTPAPVLGGIVFRR